MSGLSYTPPGMRSKDRFLVLGSDDHFCFCPTVVLRACLERPEVMHKTIGAPLIRSMIEIVTDLSLGRSIAYLASSSP